jgi:hypothetical protein
MRHMMISNDQGLRERNETRLDSQEGSMAEDEAALTR